MTAAAQRHRLAAKTQPFNARAPSDPAQKKPDIGNQSLTSNYAKLPLAGEGVHLRRCSDQASSHHS
ncbi:hypothetical protein ABIA43_007495 [Bradyrhizobium sp. USDA 328]